MRSELRFRHRAFSFLDARGPKRGPEALREAYGRSGRFSEYQNGSERFSERPRKAKIRTGGKSGRQPQFRSENEHPLTGPWFSSFLRNRLG